MKIRADTKKKTTLFFEPENDFDCYHLGMVFDSISHNINISEGKIKWLSVDVKDLWRYIFEINKQR